MWAFGGKRTGNEPAEEGGSGQWGDAPGHTAELTPDRLPPRPGSGDNSAMEKHPPKREALLSGAGELGPKGMC